MIKPAPPTKAEIKNFSRVLELAEQGDPKYQIYIGDAYFFGRIVQRNLEKAKSFFQKAASHDIIRAKYYLAKIGLIMKEADSLGRLESLAGSNYGPALFLLGKIYIDGIYVSKDRSKGLHLWERAGQYGHLVAPFYRARLMSKEAKLLDKPYHYWNVIRSLSNCLLPGVRDPTGDRFLT